MIAVESEPSPALAPPPDAGAAQTQTMGRGNNVNAVRAVLALLVIWFHSPVLLGVAHDTPTTHPFAQAPAEQLHFVGGRVLAFFFLSGLLLTPSWERSPNVLRFLWRRVARLYPAFLVCAALCLCVVLPLVSGASLPSGRTIAWSTATFRVPAVSGAFPRNPISDTLNGSLWTLLYEAWCVVILLLLGASGAIRRGYPLLTALVASWLVYAAQWFGVPIFPLFFENDATWTVFGTLEAYPRLLSCFLCGAAMHRFRARLPLLPALFWGSLGGLIVSVPLRVVGLAIPMLGGYCIAYLALSPALHAPRWLSRLGDWSYGIFLYGYPVQQVWIQVCGTGLSPLALFGLTVPVTVALAAASYYLVEKPVERLQNKMSLRTSRGDPYPAAKANP